ncbi:IS66-like element accessory protein TnpA [Ralstonia pseudosolanacearum]|uniref:IS66-like element accessory protein TnpA n=1 Tax=Ralstonia pseudosolanacearum TaxID=1310165 RepID=UPI00386BE122
MTTEDDLSYLPLRVVRIGDNGKRTFDAEDKRRLIEACRQPGVSLSGMALKAGVNANQLHKWVYGRGRRRRNEAAAAGDDASTRSAFVPVVAMGDTAVPALVKPARTALLRDEAASPSSHAAASARLTAQLPNGVPVALECGGQDAGLVKAMIEALGAR